MEYSALTRRIYADGGDAWAVHNRALEMKDQGKAVIMLSIGQEEDEVTPKHIVDAAVASLRRGDHHYTAAAGDLTLRQTIARYHESMTGQRVSEEQVTVHSGAQNALFSIALCVLNPGDEVILAEPYYTTYPATFAISGAKPVSVQMSAEHNYLPDPDTIFSSITDRTKAIVLNSPSNPLGTIYPKSVYEPILKVCIERDIFLISDEVYSSLLDPDQRFSPAALPGAENHVITVSSLSKSHRMTGWRLGWTVGPTDLAQHLAELSMSMHYGLPSFIMQAATSAIADSQGDKDISALIRNALTERRTLLLKHLNSGRNVTVHDSGFGMFVLLDVSRTGLTADDFALRLLHETQVATLPCTGFGPSGRHLIRIGLCVDGEQITVAGKRISTFIENLEHAN